MNDREFIELLNLYVDREISADDALRLESEVGSNRARRKVYDQYCRMQKACSMLSSDLADAGAGRPVLAFPAPAAWRSGPMLAGFAAAACIVAVFALRHRAALQGDFTAPLAVTVAPRTAPDASEAPLSPDPMSPVFTARIAAPQSDRSAAKAAFTVAADGAPPAQLDWIGDVRLAPVFSSANPGFLLAPKADLKAGMTTDEGPAGRYLQEPADISAFRFQR